MCSAFAIEHVGTFPCLLTFLPKSEAHAQSLSVLQIELSLNNPTREIYLALHMKLNSLYLVLLAVTPKGPV